MTTILTIQRFFWGLISTQNRMALRILFVSLLLTSILEGLSFSLIPLVIKVIQGAESQEQTLIIFLRDSAIFFDVDFKIFVVLTFSGFVVASGCLRFFVQQRLIYVGQDIGLDLNSQLLRVFLTSSYLDLRKYPSASVIGLITQKTNSVVNKLFNPLLVLGNAIFIIISISVVLAIYFSDEIWLAISSLVFIYSMLIFFCRSVVRRNGVIMNKLIFERIDIIGKIVKGIKEVLVFNLSNKYFKRFLKMESSYRLTVAQTQFLGIFPRLILEPLVVLGVVVVSYLVVVNEVTFLDVSGLVLLGLAFQKALPQVQNAYTSISVIMSHVAQLEDTKKAFGDFQVSTIAGGATTWVSDHEVPKVDWKRLEFRSVDFSFEASDEPTLSSISFTISRGSKVGIIKESGGGKTTLTNLILGLYAPSRGGVFLDGQPLSGSVMKAWSREVGVVTQELSLLPGTIGENIGVAYRGATEDFSAKFDSICKDLGIDKLLSAEHRVEKCIESAGLSRGQLQKVMIARALLSGCSMLILDEATSALDKDTEAEILDTLLGKEDLTVVVVSHDKSVIDRCSGKIGF